MLYIKNYYRSPNELKAELNSLDVSLNENDLIVLAIKLNSLSEMPTFPVFHEVVLATYGRDKIISDVLNKCGLSTYYSTRDYIIRWGDTDYERFPKYSTLGRYYLFYGIILRYILWSE